MIKRKDFLAMNGEEICRLSNAGHRLIYWEHTSGGYDFYFSTGETAGDAAAGVKATVLTSPIHTERAEVLDGLEGMSPVEVFAQLYTYMI
jgi:hypothetical protein